MITLTVLDIQHFFLGGGRPAGGGRQFVTKTFLLLEILFLLLLEAKCLSDSKRRGLNNFIKYSKKIS
jgi:hypothetical protein